MEKKIPFKKHIPMKELKVLIKKEQNKRIHERLLFIHQLYLDDNLSHACKRMCITNTTGRTYLKKWNKHGYEGLIPNFGGGRPSKLNKQQKQELKKLLKSKDNWLTTEIRALIRKEFKVSYSLRQVARIMRSFKMHYSKPYPKDYRQPDNAKEILKQSLNIALKDVEEDYILGFIDEASPQTTDNKQRFWSFKKSKIIKNTTKYKANTFGFYTANGKNIVDFKENSKKESVCEFLRTIREKNPKELIVAVIDNFRSHVAEKTKKYAESLGIIMVFLPPYSPDLNPIEQIWRCIKRRISQISIKSQWSFTETIRTTFYKLAKKLSFMSKWLETFQPSLLK